MDDTPTSQAVAETRVLSKWALTIDVDMVLRGQGADPEVVRRRRPVLVNVAERAIAEGGALIAPRVALREATVEALRHEQLRLTGGAVLTGALLAQHLAPADRVVLMVCTIGPGLEERVAHVLRADPSYGLALDGFGSVAVELLVVAACGRFEAEALAAGHYTSIPLSPGMIGWPVDVGQAQIFAQVDATPIGVSLTESAQMTPRKSSSLVLGIGSDLFSEGRACDFCTLRDTCVYQDQLAVFGGEHRRERVYCRRASQPGRSSERLAPVAVMGRGLRWSHTIRG